MVPVLTSLSFWARSIISCLVRGDLAFLTMRPKTSGTIPPCLPQERRA